MDDIVKNKTEQNVEETIAYENLPARELIKVTEENATVLWATFCNARENAEELFKESEYYGTSLFLKDCFMSSCMATMLGVVLKWGELPLTYKKRLSEELEENLKNHRKQKLYQLVETDDRYWTDGERIFPCMSTWNVNTQWDKLKQILAKEKGMGMCSDLLEEAENPFDAETDDIHVYTEQVKRDAIIQTVRRVVLAKHMSYANEIVNTIGISREEADVLVEECNIRKKINADLDSSYLFEAILGLRLWIQIAMEEKKTESEITYLAGLSIEKTGEWIENPEKQMVYVANCHGFGDEYIAEMLHLPVEQVQSYINKIGEDYGTDNTYYESNHLFEINRMPLDCKKALYQKYLRE